MAILLKLYIVGNTNTSIEALSNLNELLNGHLKDLYELRVIDVLKEPQEAENDRIRATPTLIRDYPPIKKLIGDLSDKQKVVNCLKLKEF